MFSSWVWEPNFAAVSTVRGKQAHGMRGRKSVTTNCKHWKASRTKCSLEWSGINRNQLEYTNTMINLKWWNSPCSDSHLNLSLNYIHIIQILKIYSIAPYFYLPYFVYVVLWHIIHPLYISVILLDNPQTYLWLSLIAPMILRIRGHPWCRSSPQEWRICRRDSSCFCRTSGWPTSDISDNGDNKSVCSFCNPKIQEN